MPRVTCLFVPLSLPLSLSLSRMFGVAAVGVVAVAAAGCAGPAERLNAPPQGWTSHQADMQQHYVYMTDNTLLAEMDVTDVHFVPHSAALNSLGARRLDRYAALLKDSGGQLNYDTELEDGKLIQQRIASVKEYLTAAGADPAKITVAQGPAGTAGMSAEEAIVAHDKATAGFPADKQSTSGGMGQSSQSGY
jgi:alkanesulfonate monooxygenase SsuD/methylene tetrahydromethanopterin reductase-like flavin-dependent oxidoreductase (luciferase family)